PFGKEARQLVLHLGGNEVEVHFLAVGSNEQVDLRARAAAKRLEGHYGQHVVAVDGDEAADAIDGLDPVWVSKVEAGQRLCELLHGRPGAVEVDRAKALLVRRDLEQARELADQPLCDADVPHHSTMAALDDGPPEQALGKGRGD